MADFTGFYFDGIHSSAYHIVRVSDGDRYTEGLFPEFKDRASELVGGEGSVYEGTDFQQTSFTINIAFDKLTEKDFMGLKKWLDPRKLKEFRFDERPYKAYWAKLERRPEFEYICFLENGFKNGVEEACRVYKGEAKLDFIAYNPFGYCNDNSFIMTPNGLKEVDGINWQVLDSYVPFNIVDDNVGEWGAVSGLKNLDELAEYNSFEEEEDRMVDNKSYYMANLYNAGEFETDFELFIEMSPSGGAESVSERLIEIQITPKDNEEEKEFFQFSINGLYLANNILLKTKNHSLIVYGFGSDNDGGIITSKNLRYDLVKSTHWPKIPIGESEMKITGLSGMRVEIKYGYKYY
jgi:hypothetical protein